jgi:hypothetical protein
VIFPEAPNNSRVQLITRPDLRRVPPRRVDTRSLPTLAHPAFEPQHHPPHLVDPIRLEPFPPLRGVLHALPRPIALQRALEYFCGAIRPHVVPRFGAHPDRRGVSPAFSGRPDGGEVRGQATLGSGDGIAGLGGVAGGEDAEGGAGRGGGGGVSGRIVEYKA